jgi:cardiolipin synthase
VKPQWRDGNRISLLENGEQFYPRVFQSIDAARQEVLLETFIWFDDVVGRALQAVLLNAAKRGVRVDVTVDGYGSPDLSSGFIGALTAAGVRFHVFDPRRKVFGFRTNLFRRMHRKIVVIDAARAFVGGINYSADHLFDFGPQAKQDYAAELEGPIVDDIHRFARSAIAPVGGKRRWRRRGIAASTLSQAAVGTAQALFVTRDNRDHRDDIERHYRVAIRGARREVIIANAYFFPGYRLLRELRRAARRGVSVHLILQGQPDMPIVKIAAGLLYDYLLNSGVTIHEYCMRPLHGKVALTDDEWATIGSSNLDPLSLSLNLEAIVVVRDQAFNQQLRRSLQDLMQNHCERLGLADAPKRTLWRALVGAIVFHFLRRFPAWAGWLPAHVPRLASLPPRAGTSAVASAPAGGAREAGISEAGREARQALKKAIEAGAAIQQAGSMTGAGTTGTVVALDGDDGPMRDETGRLQGGAEQVTEQENKAP